MYELDGMRRMSSGCMRVVLLHVVVAIFDLLVVDNWWWFIWQFLWKNILLESGLALGVKGMRNFLDFVSKSRCSIALKTFQKFTSPQSWGQSLKKFGISWFLIRCLPSAWSYGPSSALEWWTFPSYRRPPSPARLSSCHWPWPRGQCRTRLLPGQPTWKLKILNDCVSDKRLELSPKSSVLYFQLRPFRGFLISKACSCKVNLNSIESQSAWLGCLVWGPRCATKSYLIKKPLKALYLPFVQILQNRLDFILASFIQVSLFPNPGQDLRGNLPGLARVVTCRSCSRSSGHWCCRRGRGGRLGCRCGRWFGRGRFGWGSLSGRCRWLKSWNQSLVRKLASWKAFFVDRIVFRA